MISARRQHAGGFTLLESLLAATILAMAITAITAPFTAGAQNNHVQARRVLAVSLAQEMLEEILAKPFADPDGASSPGPESAEADRSQFDNIDDYHDYTESNGAIADAHGALADGPAAEGLSRSVSTTYVFVTGQDTGEAPTFIRVIVEMSYRDQPILTLTRLVYAIK